MRIPPPEKRDAFPRSSLDDAPSDDEAGAKRAPKLAPLDGAFSATYHDAEAAARAQLREPPRPIDFPKMRKIRTLHKEGSNAFHEELRTAHGIDAKDLDGSQVRADTDAFQSVCEPERDGGAVTRREVEELLCDLERRLKGEAPATSTSPRDRAVGLAAADRGGRGLRDRGPPAEARGARAGAGPALPGGHVRGRRAAPVHGR